ncbi:MAG: hypothetical protein S0880_06695 [Actinomycetota bacterium]|nr:hypothetical protein [Actinomycetota bacterium]
MSADTFYGLRELLIPGPSQTTGYRTVLVIGTTGAGKSTLIRQLMGTDPKTEAFPATSTSKTTVAEAELLLAPGDHFAAITFMPLADVRTYVEECVVAAALAAFEERSETEIRTRLLEHVDQRFRLKYVLSDGLSGDPAIDGVGDRDDDSLTTVQRIRRNTEAVLGQIRALLDEAVRAGLEELTAEGLVDDDVDNDELFVLLRHRLVGHPTVGEIVSFLVEEIAARFDLMDPEELTRGQDGWPLYWRFQTDDRAKFMRSLRRFVSIDAEEFGLLLTPIVNGIRVRGPFHPTWANEIPYVMLLDREGLGHTPDSVSSLPSSTTRMLDDVDVVVIVDNAQQPMQAAPVAAMRQIAAAGHGDKLVLVFTHFDMVHGPNLPDLDARRHHVIASVDQVLSAIGSDLGYPTERLLRYRLDRNLYLLEHLHKPIDENSDVRTVRELQWLLSQLRVEATPLELGDCRPVYELDALRSTVHGAISGFLQSWERKLGLGTSGAPAVHWSKIKALCVRYARRSNDEYESLRPAGDLLGAITDSLRRFVTFPTRWTGEPPDEETAQQLYDHLTRQAGAQLRPLVRSRLFDDAGELWAEARDIEGQESAQRRAEFIMRKILEQRVPAGGGAPVGDEQDFAAAVVRTIVDSASELDVEFAE